MKNKKWRWLAPVLWGLLITILSLMPGGQGDLMLFGIPHFDKIGHFGIYAVWALLIFYAWRPIYASPERGLIWKIIVLVSLAGVVFEFGQHSLTQGRSFEYMDMVANLLGAVAGSFAGKRLFDGGTKK